MVFKKQPSKIIQKAKEERIIFEAVYNFFDDDTLKDDMVTIGRIYHDGNDFEVVVVIEPYKFIFLVTYDAITNSTNVRAYRPVEVQK